jgi:hypothetical protein
MNALSKRLAVLLGLLPAIVGGLLLFSPGCTNDGKEPPPPPTPKKVEGPPIYQDMTGTSGIHFTYKNGEEAGHYAILESLGGGVALIDYDGDGLLDIFVPGGGHFDKTVAEYKKEPKREPKILGYPCKLYKNLGGFKFKDVTAEVGLDQIDFYTHGAAVGDYNRDGWPDLLVTGYGRVAFFRNEPDGKGGRRFVEVTKEAGLIGKGAGTLSEHFWATSAGFADFDGDGWPDLYICQYVNWSWMNNPECPGYTPKYKQDVCPPRKYDAVAHAVYRNTGKGGFVDVTRECGIRFPGRSKEVDDQKEYGKGLGVVIGDVNGDGRPDFYVANDTVDHFLYINRSTPGKIRFDDVGFDMGVARDDHGVPNGGMGTDLGDPFGTGRASIWCTNYENELHALYRNEIKDGKGFFTYATLTSGIARIGQLYVGFGTAFVDVDNDGWEDIAITNGHVIKHPAGAGLRQQPVLFHNEGQGRFEVITERGGSYFQAGHRGRGLAVGDLDNDGRPDLVFSNVNEPVAVLRNVDGSGHHWLGVRLQGKDHADYVGARLLLEVNGRTLARFAKGGGSYLSANDRRILFGLGKVDKAGRLTVEWPPDATGKRRIEHWDHLALDRYHTLVQGTGKRD